MHMNRHMFALNAIKDNFPWYVLQQWLGYSSIFTTSAYTQITWMYTSEFMGGYDAEIGLEIGTKI